MGKLFLELPDGSGVVSVSRYHLFRIKGIGVDVKGLWPFNALMALGAGGSGRIRDQ